MIKWSKWDKTPGKNYIQRTGEYQTKNYNVLVIQGRLIGGNKTYKNDVTKVYSRKKGAK